MNKNVLGSVLLLKQIASRFSLTRLTKAIAFFPTFEMEIVKLN
jgi:hypothetical protein